MPINKETHDLAKDLISFMQGKFGFDHLPKIRFLSNKQNASNILGMTGGYDQENEIINVYISDRHPKDVLRSLAHEMMHHVQKCEGKLDNNNTASTSDPNYIMHDDYLKDIEADAFKRGNITFREWEATKKGGKQMNEEKKMSKPTIKKAHKAAKSALKHGGFSQYDDPEAVAYATMTKKAKEGDLEEAEKPDYLDFNKDGDKEQPMKDAIKDAKKKGMMETKEIEINQALKDSHTYVPQDRALADAYNNRDERIYNDLLKKFGIKK